MKRFRVYFILVALMCSYGFAETTDSAEKNIATENATSDFDYKKIGGGFWSCAPERSGGFGEFGWCLSDESKKGFVLRDCFTVGGYGHKVIKSSVDFGELQIGNRLTLGGVYDGGNFKVRSYGFFGAGVGIIGGEGIRFFHGAPMFEVNGGGGFEFQFTKNSAFVIEYGGRCEMPVGRKAAQYSAYTNSSPILTIGYRALN